MTTSTKIAASDFLACRRIAVTGVSHAPKGHASNGIYIWLRDKGYEVFAVNPTVTEVEGDTCYPDLRSIPGGVDAVLIATSPLHAQATMEQAAELGITQVWMHRSFGAGSVSTTAAVWGREHGITVIDGGCPLMFHPEGDGGHKFLCKLFTLTGKVPRAV